MLEIKKILFPTDFSKSANSALSWALLLAKNFESELDMLHAVVLHQDDVGNEVYSRFPDLDKCIANLMENADSRLETTIEDSGKLNIKQFVQRGMSVVEEILSFSEKNDVDLIVMGTHGRRGISNFLLGSVTERVVRGANCPVLTIRQKEDPDAKIDVTNLVLPIDFSKHSREAARHAIVLAKIMAAKLHVVHVLDSSIHPAFHTVDMGSALKLDSELEDRIKANMDKFMKDCQATFDYSLEVLEGKPEVEIANYTDDLKNGMVIISSHGAGGLERILIGSTTERVIKLTQSPVLTLKVKGRNFVK